MIYKKKINKKYQKKKIRQNKILNHLMKLNKFGKLKIKKLEKWPLTNLKQKKNKRDK